MPPYLKETVLRIFKIELIFNFFRTRKAVLAKEHVWDLKKNELIEKKYLNPWEFTIAENFVASLIGIILGFMVSIPLFKEVDINLFSNSNSLILSAITLLALVIMIIQLSKSALPRSSTKQDKNKALQMMLYHWGAHGLIVKSVYIGAFGLLGVALKYAATTSQYGLGHTVGMLLFVIVIIATIIEFIYVLYSVFFVRNLLDNPSSKIIVSFKILLALIIIMLINTAIGIVIQIANGLYHMDDLEQFFEDSELSEFYLAVWLIFQIGFGAYLFFKSKKKIRLVKVSALLAFFIPLIVSCTSSGYDAMGSQITTFYESPPESNWGNSFFEILFIDPNFSLAWVYAGHLLLAFILVLTSLCILDYILQKVLLTINQIIEGKSLIKFLLFIGVTSILFFLIQSAYFLIFPKQNLSFDYDKHAKIKNYQNGQMEMIYVGEPIILVNGKPYIKNGTYHQGKHEFFFDHQIKSQGLIYGKIEIPKFKPIKGSFFISNKHKIVDLKNKRKKIK